MSRVLVADDDEQVRRVLSRALERAGHDVETVRSGTEALVAIESAAPDLVVTDINMPDMDGIELLVHLVERGGIKVIAISGGGLFPRDELLADAELLGAVDVMGKPFELDELVARVTAALESD